MGNVIQMPQRQGTHFELHSTKQKVWVSVTIEGATLKGWMTPDEARETGTMYLEAADDAEAQNGY